MKKSWIITIIVIILLLLVAILIYSSTRNKEEPPVGNIPGPTSGADNVIDDDVFEDYTDIQTDDDVFNTIDESLDLLG